MTAALSTGAPWLCSPLPPQGSLLSHSPVFQSHHEQCSALPQELHSKQPPAPAAWKSSILLTLCTHCSPSELSLAADPGRDQPVELILLHSGAAAEGMEEFQPLGPTVPLKAVLGTPHKGSPPASPGRLQRIRKGIKGHHVTWGFLSAWEPFSGDGFCCLTVESCPAELGAVVVSKDCIFADFVCLSVFLTDNFLFLHNKPF